MYSDPTCLADSATKSGSIQLWLWVTYEKLLLSYFVCHPSIQLREGVPSPSPHCADRFNGANVCGRNVCAHVAYHEFHPQATGHTGLSRNNAPQARDCLPFRKHHPVHAVPVVVAADVILDGVGWPSAYGVLTYPSTATFWACSLATFCA